MIIVVISPESADSREVGAMEGLFRAGLERYHLRKPTWTSDALEAWLLDLPTAWRTRIVLHQHQGLVEKLGLGGAHHRDDERTSPGRGFSLSSHDVYSLRASLPFYRSIFLGPVFPSITKQGYGPPPDFPWDGLKSVLGKRTAADGRVLAIGGVTAGGLPRCRDLGFDGAAVLGAVWSEHDPVAAFEAIRDTAARLEGARDAA